MILGKGMHMRRQLTTMMTGAAVLLIASLLRAGDVTTDNLTVNKDATFYGNVKITSLGVAQVPTNGLIMYYSFSTNVTPVSDDSGCGNTGTLGSAISWITNGVTGGGYNFNGGYIKVLSPNFDLSGDFTISVWVYPTTWTDNTWEYELLTRSGIGNTGFRFCLGGILDSSSVGKLRWLGQNGGGLYGAYSSSALQLGQWQFVTMALSNSSGRVSFYINGQPCGTGLQAESTPGGSGMAVIGACDWDFGDGLFKGLMDEYRIYNRCLSADEVMGLYLNDAHLAAGDATFETGVKYLKPLGNLGMGTYTNQL